MITKPSQVYQHCCQHLQDARAAPDGQSCGSIAAAVHGCAVKVPLALLAFTSCVL